MPTQSAQNGVVTKRPKGNLGTITGGDQGIGRAMALRFAAEAATSLSATAPTALVPRRSWPALPAKLRERRLLSTVGKLGTSPSWAAVMDPESKDSRNKHVKCQPRRQFSRPLSRLHAPLQETLPSQGRTAVPQFRTPATAAEGDRWREPIRLRQLRRIHALTQAGYGEPLPASRPTSARCQQGPLSPRHQRRLLHQPRSTRRPSPRPPPCESRIRCPGQAVSLRPILQLHHPVVDDFRSR